MLFNSYAFIFAFLPVVLWAWYRAARYEGFRLLLLTVASYLFYAYWDWRFCILMLLSTVVDYVCGLKLHESETSSRRKAWLVLSLASNLSLLAFFKYSGFLLENINFVIGLGGGEEFSVWNIILPAGISFYTFQSMSYSIDIYKNDASPTKSLIHFACYVSMFPQLIAGPIVRYHELDDQLRNLKDKLDPNSLILGLQFFILGLSKKLLIADLIAQRVDPLFLPTAKLDLITSWLAMVGYTFQLYFDFSGYSDMAIGLGLLFGLSFPQNFDSPYKSKNISEFWRKWHMSFSFWLRDYLYISLGGSRGGRSKTLRNLMITMFLGGLWHGANWTFVVWGLYHGLLLVAHNVWRSEIKWRMPAPLAVSMTFVAVMIGWVFFRSETFSVAGSILHGLIGGMGVQVDALGDHMTLIAMLIGALSTCLFAPNTWDMKKVDKIWKAALLGLLFTVCILKLGSPSPFLYFQF